ncbi:hypothetical protein [Pontibacter cellulosilyticus]|uniref:Uncharacterized protein n=1 Tax=Pontibacter cellulosilyticus TaxID=1720253 RepID=A0A923N9V6_9BACT|nr:hypothetical protein [Pontibacter cellulosilyticus]MBC5993080.1 hypothetical protein [Pontibacter cellulosilyticus]
MFLLRLRHWLAFLLLFVFPFIIRYALTELFAFTGMSVPAPLAVVLDALPTLVPVYWLWRMGLYFYRRLPASIKISAIYFHLAALYFALYILLLIYTLGYVRDSIADGMLPLGMLALLLPIHLFATFCYLYMVYFVARSIASVEQQRIITLEAYILPLAQVLFLPIGIWFLQPRLNRLTSKLPIP